MQIYPHNALEQLRFPELLDEIASNAIGSPARLAIQNLRPDDQLAKIEGWLSHVRFMMNAIQAQKSPELVYYEIPEALDRCFQIEGFVLSKEDCLQIKYLLENSSSIELFLQSIEEEEPETPFIHVPSTNFLLAQLQRIFDEQGEINPHASEALYGIVRKIQKKESEISTVFNRIAKQYRGQGLLSEIEESYRNGRRVLALPVENKRKIAGIIHGESESGKTVYIEPQAVTEVNNAIYQLHADKQKEVYKILQEISGSIRLSQDVIQDAIELVGQVDAALAKARFARNRALQIPVFDPEVTLHFKAAFHPHLAKHLQSEGKKIVENDIILHGKNRILLISGPNAGGKSVALKTIAFGQIMFQCGLPVPAEVDTRMRLFSSLALDMGDNQSIEDDLSTYSSHLLHMKKMIEIADENALVLIDEFGTGTDPRVGGALAESILEVFLKKGATAVITTHYSNLKSYAHKQRGIVNGSMSFDMNQLSPTYQLQIGKPGSSFAFEIAKRMGLPQEIISLAKDKAGSQVYEMEKLLNQLTHEKEKVRKKENELKIQEDELKTLTSTYTALKKQLDVQRKKYKAERKEALARLKAENIKSLEAELDELKSQAAAQEAIAQKLEQEKQAQIAHIQSAKSLNEEAYQMSGEWVSREDLRIGDFVQIRQTESVGQIDSLEKKFARVAVGPMIMKVPYENLVKARSPLEIKSKRSISYSKPTSSIPSRLDIRGMSFKEAEAVLTQYFDDALMRHMHHVEILHGRGNGVLRKLVAKKAGEYKDIKSVTHPEEEAGGEAVSIIQF